MQPIGSSFNTTFLNQVHSTVQQEGGHIFTLTPLEKMFLAFVKNRIQVNLDQKNDLFYLGTGEPVQRDFSEWVAKTWTSKAFAADELHLVTVISSIWMKAKNQVKNELKANQNQEAIENEKQLQRTAKRTIEEICLQGHSGKVFTLRQAHFLLTAANNPGK
jgi:hypothetical protein